MEVGSARKLVMEDSAAAVSAEAAAAVAGFAVVSGEVVSGVVVTAARAAEAARAEEGGIGAAARLAESSVCRPREDSVDAVVRDWLV